MKRVSIFAEGYYGSDHAKTAHGLIRHGKNYKIVEVVDSTLAGKDAGEFIGAGKIGIPIVNKMSDDVDVMLIGIAPAGGRLPEKWRTDIKNAITKGINIVSGLHQFISDDEELKSLADKYNVDIFDVRKPPKNLDIARGYKPKAKVILFAGMDSCIGKRTALLEFLKIAETKIKTGFVATGQTGIMIGCDAGIVVDAIPSDFVSGAIEQMIKKVDKNKELILVEGQGSMFHSAYGAVAAGILLGAKPNAVILVHAPTRKIRNSYIEKIPTVEDEIEIIEKLGKTKVVGITLNCENIKNWKNVIRNTKKRYLLPTADMLKQSVSEKTDFVNEVLQTIHLQ